LFANECQPLGQIDFFKPGTVAERHISNLLHTVWDMSIGQILIAVKCTLTDFCDPFGNGDRCQ
jgi:hypothetical protein